MVQQELEAKIAALEARLKELEDIEGIKQLMATYEDHNDSLERLDEVLACFTEDGKFEVAYPGVAAPGDAGAHGFLLGSWEGQEGLRKLYGQSFPTLSYSAHHVTNPIITVDGDKAKGTWYLLAPFTFLAPQGPIAVWEQGTYHGEFARVDGKWKISSMKFEWNFTSPHEDGWVKKRMMGT